MYFLTKLKSFQVSSTTLINFYRAIIESILTQSIMVWYDRASKSKCDLGRLNSVIRNAEKLIGASLPSLESIYDRMASKMNTILKEEAHPARHYFEFLPHGRNLRAFKGTNRLVKSFFPQANKHSLQHWSSICTT